MANFDDLEIEYDGEKKSIFPNSYRHVLFAKNRVQVGQIWPVWLHIYFTSGYRGFPPCTLSLHPDSRETGYSNVLDLPRGGGGTTILLLWMIKINFQHLSFLGSCSRNFHCFYQIRARKLSLTSRIFLAEEE